VLKIHKWNSTRTICLLSTSVQARIRKELDYEAVDDDWTVPDHRVVSRNLRPYRAKSGQSCRSQAPWNYELPFNSVLPPGPMGHINARSTLAEAILGTDAKRALALSLPARRRLPGYLPPRDGERVAKSPIIAEHGQVRWAEADVWAAAVVIAIVITTDEEVFW